MTPATLACPTCARDVTLAIAGELSLPPTGGDHEWCEGQERHRCPACGQHLAVRVRAYLDGAAPRVVGVEAADPDPHPWAPRALALSPDGATVAVASASGAWLASRTAGGWGPPRPVRSRGVDLRSPPPPVWSGDGRLLLADGRVVDADGRVAVDLPWPYTTVLATGWSGDAAVVAWRELDDRRWLAGVDRVTAAGTRSIAWPADDGFVMGGRVVVAADGARLYRLQPPYHGAWTATLRRFRLEPDDLALTAEATDRRSIEAAHLAGDTLLLATGERSDHGWQRAVEWLDATTLAVRRTARVPSDWFGSTDILIDVVPAGGDRVVVLTSNQARLAHPEGTGLVADRPLDLRGARAAVWRDGALLLAGPWSLAELRDGALVPVPLPDA